VAPAGFSPYLELSGIDGPVIAAAWMLDGDAVGDGSSVPGWGYGMRLVFRRAIKLDVVRIRRESGLRQQSILRLATAWSARSAVNLGMKAASVEVPLSGDDTLEHDLVIDVPSPSVAEILILRTVLVLEHRGSDATSPVAAAEPGSVLWKDSATIVLEGRSARMPILAIDFGGFQIAEQGAAWFVSTGPEWLVRHPTSGITVYVNGACRGLLAGLSARRPDPHESFLQSVFFHDVGRVLIERALDDDDFTDDADYPPGCTGNSLRATLRSVFGHQTVAQIRKFRRSDATGFERTLQTRHKLLGALV
jgi:hypothetical protein